MHNKWLIFCLNENDNQSRKVGPKLARNCNHCWMWRAREKFCKILAQPLKLLIICSIQPKLIVTFVMEGFWSLSLIIFSLGTIASVLTLAILNGNLSKIVDRGGPPTWKDYPAVVTNPLLRVLICKYWDANDRIIMILDHNWPQTGCLTVSLSHHHPLSH